MERQHDKSSGRFLTFRVDAQLYALRSEDVLEVIRVPSLARIPQAPPALLGVANLRGTVLPIAGLRELLQKPAATDLSDARAIVLDLGAPVAVVVDSVDTLETVDPERIETRKKELSAEGAEKLAGAFQIEREQAVAKILDIKTLLEDAFANRARGAVQGRAFQSAAVVAPTAAASKEAEMLVTFEVAGQEFALPLDVVQEILPASSTVASVARAEAVVVGMTSVRDTLLPLMSLRGLLGFGAAPRADDREKVIVTKVAGVHVGLVADDARSVLAADVAQVDPIPPVLAARTGGESRIKSIYRGEGGRRLISILAPELLFREDVMQRLAADAKHQKSQTSTVASGSQSELIFLVFRLGDSEFGLPIETIVEVAQVPAQITRLPKTPKFLEGIVNLRGDVLPVIDQRRRFDMPKAADLEGRRLVVITTQRHRAGLIVDSVSDVLRARAEDVAPPPDLTDATSRLVKGVINLEEANRMVLLLDPAEVLTRAEQGILDRFQAASEKANE